MGGIGGDCRIVIAGGLSDPSAVESGAVSALCTGESGVLDWMSQNVASGGWRAYMDSPYFSATLLMVASFNHGSQ